jgi:serine/threonine protein kinase
MVHLQDPTGDQRRVIDAVVDVAFATSARVLGRAIRFREGLGGREHADKVLDSCVPHFLEVSGPKPHEYYQPTLAGLVASSQTAWVSRALDGVVRFLGKRVRADANSSEFLLSDLRKEVPDLIDIDARKLRELIEIAHLTKQVTYMQGEDVRFEMPPHVELVAEWEGFPDLLKHELERQASRSAAPPEPALARAADSTSRVFETAYCSYTYVKNIGEGAVGFVHEVADEEGSHRALKIFKPGEPQERRRKRFRNELKYCFENRHPHIVRVHDWGVTESDGETVPFFIMDLYPATLRDKINAKLDPDAAVVVFRQLVDAVSSAHAAGVWHRDLKPENILIATNGTAVLADFGIAHFVESMLATAIETQPGDRLANFEYAAPEQGRKGQTVTAAADVYALGLILNEMFTGIPPHGKNAPTIGSVAPKLAGLDLLVERMLNHSPDKRPKSSELGDLLDSAIAGTLDSENSERGGSVVDASHVAKQAGPSDAERLARHLCAVSPNGNGGSEAYALDAARKELQMSETDIHLAIDELVEKGLVRTHEVLGGKVDAILAEWSLYFEFDESVKGWRARDDALIIAREMVRDNGANPLKLAEKLGWPARRMNPACAYLATQDKVMFRKWHGMGDFAYGALVVTDRTRRLARDGW